MENSISGASSMLPVMALAPQENERILDLCSAPGGKSSHIAAIMKNTGVLFSNDANSDRIKAVVGNFHRLGMVNAVISCEDGCKYGSIMQGFDRILLDAPCTGTGVVSKDPSVKISKSDVDIQRCYNLQRKLLISAIDCLNSKSPTGGYLVYSTCSILPEENEWVIDYALKKRNVKLVSTGLDFGTEGFVNYRQFRFHPSMKLTRRYYPHSHNMDGFFVAKLKKFSDVIPAGGDDIEEENESYIDTTLSNANGHNDKDDSNIATKKKQSKDTESMEIKKRKREEDNKKYVAKVFEKPVVKKKENPNNKVASNVDATLSNANGQKDDSNIATTKKQSKAVESVEVKKGKREADKKKNVTKVVEKPVDKKKQNSNNKVTSNVDISLVKKKQNPNNEITSNEIREFLDKLKSTPETLASKKKELPKAQDNVVSKKVNPNKYKFVTKLSPTEDDELNVDDLSDSFALKVKSKMKEKKMVKKIGKFKGNKKQQSPQSHRFKSKFKKMKKK